MNHEKCFSLLRCVYTGQTKVFIESCMALETGLPSETESKAEPKTQVKTESETKSKSGSEKETGLVTIEVHQDLESAAGGRLFNIIYYFYRSILFELSTTIVSMVVQLMIIDDNSVIFYVSTPLSIIHYFPFSLETSLSIIR